MMLKKGSFEFANIKKTLVAVLIGYLACTSGHLLSGSGSTWAKQIDQIYSSVIQIPVEESLTQEGGFELLKITPDVYAHAQFDLRDIRITDGSGKTVPYASLEKRNERIVRESRVKLIADGARREKKRDVHDFKTPSTDQKDVLLDGLELWADASQDYLLKVKIWGSYDGENFEEVAEGSIYQVKDYCSKEILFLKPQKYKTYRVETDQPTRTLIALSAIGKRSSVTDKSEANLIYVNAKFKQIEDGKKTVITISDVKNLPLRSLNLVTDDLYHRQASLVLVNGTEREVAFEGELMRQYLGDNVLVNPDVVFEKSHYPYDQLELTIDNKDDDPIKVKSIKIAYQPDLLVFKAKSNEHYKLTYGNKDLNAPEYDLTQVVEGMPDLIMGHATLAKSEAVEVTPTKNDEANQKRSKLILNSTIIFAGLILGLISFRAMRTKP